MAKGNPNPETDHLKVYQHQPKNDRAMGKTIGTRYQIEVDVVLREMEADERQDFIRAAVTAQLQAEGRLE